MLGRGKKKSGMKIVVFMFIIKEILSPYEKIVIFMFTIKEILCPTSKTEFFTFQQWENASHITFFLVRKN